MKVRNSFFLIVLLSSLVVHAKRRAPKPVDSVSHEGLRFEAPHWDLNNKGQNRKHNGAYIKVVNEKSNLPICLKQVYEVKYNEKLETDVQDNFITKLTIEGPNLVVAREKGSSVKVPLEYICN